MKIKMFNPDWLKTLHIDMHDAIAVNAARVVGYRYSGPAFVAPWSVCVEYRAEYDRLYGSRKVKTKLTKC